MKLDITEVRPKTAENIGSTRMHDTPYHNAIARAARKLVRDGRGGWMYVTSWSSYTTVWQSPDKRDTVAVKVEEAFE